MAADPTALASLLAGTFQKLGSYKPDMSGFVRPELQGLLVHFCSVAGVEPGALAGSQTSEGTKAGVGDAEHGLKAGLPHWLAKFQSKAERSAQWGETEQAYSRLLGAFFYAYFTDKYYAPNGMAMPANVEYFLLHLGKSNPVGAKWAPTPRPGYVGNGAATFSVIGGGGANYCAAASSKALLNGLAMFGYKCSASGYAPGGKGQGHGCKVKAQQGRKAGAENRPLPGDVLSIRTAVGPMSGHVITVAWAETDGTKSGEMWYVSGNSMHASVGCDFARVADAAGRPPKGSVAVINRCINSALQPDKLEKLDAAGLSALGMQKLDGDFPAANQPRATEAGAPGAAAPDGGAPGTAPTSGATPAPDAALPAAPRPEDTLGSGDVATVAGGASAQPTVIRVGKHSSEPPAAPPAAAPPAAAPAGSPPAAPGATPPTSPPAAPGAPGTDTPVAGADVQGARVLPNGRLPHKELFGKFESFVQGPDHNDPRPKKEWLASRTPLDFFTTANNFCSSYPTYRASGVNAGTSRQFGSFRAKGSDKNVGTQHHGEDLYLPPGTVLYAPFAGEVLHPYGDDPVVASNRSKDYGWFVFLRSSEEPNLTIALGHVAGRGKGCPWLGGKEESLPASAPVLPSKGQKFAAGQPIAISYNTKRMPSGYSHLHLEAFWAPGSTGSCDWCNSQKSKLSPGSNHNALAMFNAAKLLKP